MQFSMNKMKLNSIFPKSQRCLCWLNGKENILCQTCQCRLNLKKTKQWRRKCYMHNNWQASRAWNKFEDKKVIIAKGALSNPTHLTTGQHLLQISGGGVPDHWSPLYLCMGVVSTENPRRDNRALTFPW